jgi:hypothetical protein
MPSVWFAAALALTGCTGCQTTEPPPACFTVDTSCAPLYPTPSFANVYSMTITRSCGSDRSSCHSTNGDSGMSFATEQAAFDGLARYVMPGDPSCSELVVRTSSTGHSYSMPKGSTPLIPAERCALIQWVQGGAPR